MNQRITLTGCLMILSCCIYAQFSFVHITDLHIADGSSAGGYDLNGVIFEQVIDEINNLNPKPAFVVATGDISHAGAYGSNGMFPAITQYLYPDSMSNPAPGDYFIDSLHTIPIYFIPGNHDYRTTNVPPWNGDLTYFTAYLCSEPDYFFVHQNTAIICMNSGYDDLRPLWEDTNVMSPESSGFTNEQIIWLRAVLSANANKLKIILMHSPPVNVVGLFCDGSVFTGTFVDMADGSIKYNRDVFLNTCDSNNVDAVVAGHAHQNVVVSRSGVIVNENWADSTRYVQTGASLNGCYRIISVDSGFVNVGFPQIAQPTSVNETYSSDVVIYPNPSTGIFTVEGEGILSIGISDISGRVIRQISVKSNQTSIDLTGQPKGMYFVKVHNSEKIQTVKILIQ